jgi:hypothetical protein
MTGLRRAYLPRGYLSKAAQMPSLVYAIYSSLDDSLRVIRSCRPKQGIDVRRKPEAEMEGNDCSCDDSRY